MTEEEDVGDCLGQGTSGAGLISAANLDTGLQKFFKKDESESNTLIGDVAMLGKVRIQPIASQDDVGSICQDVKMARSQADKLTNMTLEKILEAHPEKSEMIVMGSKKYKEKVVKELEANPIFLTNFILFQTRFFVAFLT